MRLIDADKLKEKVFSYNFKALIDDAPTVDIVRCKDCKYAKKFNERWFICRMWYPPRLDNQVDTTVSADDFCSKGEKKCL